MTDEYWKKRAADMEHHQPAHTTQGKSLDDVLSGVPGMPSLPGHNNNNGEIDASQIMARRLSQQMQTQGMPGMSVQPSQQQGPQAQIVFVKEGVRAYRRLEGADWGHTTPLARLVGPQGGVEGKQFEFKGTVNVYIVEGNGPIDMSNVDPSKLKRLAVISAPFVGTLLVSEGAIFGQGGPDRSLLKG